MEEGEHREPRSGSTTGHELDEGQHIAAPTAPSSHNSDTPLGTDEHPSIPSSHSRSEPHSAVAAGLESPVVVVVDGDDTGAVDGSMMGAPDEPTSEEEEKGIGAVRPAEQETKHGDNEEEQEDTTTASTEEPHTPSSSLPDVVVDHHHTDTLKPGDNGDDHERSVVHEPSIWDLGPLGESRAAGAAGRRAEDAWRDHYLIGRPMASRWTGMRPLSLLFVGGGLPCALFFMSVEVSPDASVRPHIPWVYLLAASAAPSAFFLKEMFLHQVAPPPGNPRRHYFYQWHEKRLEDPVTRLLDLLHVPLCALIMCELPFRGHPVLPVVWVGIQLIVVSGVLLPYVCLRQGLLQRALHHRLFFLETTANDPGHAIDRNVHVAYSFILRQWDSLMHSALIMLVACAGILAYIAWDGVLAKGADDDGEDDGDETRPVSLRDRSHVLALVIGEVLLALWIYASAFFCAFSSVRTVRTALFRFRVVACTAFAAVGIQVTAFIVAYREVSSIPAHRRLDTCFKVSTALILVASAATIWATMQSAVAHALHRRLRLNDLIEFLHAVFPPVSAFEGAAALPIQWQHYQASYPCTSVLLPSVLHALVAGLPCCAALVVELLRWGGHDDASSEDTEASRCDASSLRRHLFLDLFIAALASFAFFFVAFWMELLPTRKALWRSFTVWAAVYTLATTLWHMYTLLRFSAANPCVDALRDGWSSYLYIAAVFDHATFIFIFAVWALWAMRMLGTSQVEGTLWSSLGLFPGYFTSHTVKRASKAVGWLSIRASHHAVVTIPLEVAASLFGNGVASAGVGLTVVTLAMNLVSVALLRLRRPVRLLDTGGCFDGLLQLCCCLWRRSANRRHGDSPSPRPSPGGEHYGRVGQADNGGEARSGNAVLEGRPVDGANNDSKPETSGDLEASIELSSLARGEEGSHHNPSHGSAGGTAATTPPTSPAACRSSFSSARVMSLSSSSTSSTTPPTNLCSLWLPVLVPCFTQAVSFAVGVALILDARSKRGAVAGLVICSGLCRIVAALLSTTNYKPGACKTLHAQLRSAKMAHTMVQRNPRWQGWALTAEGAANSPLRTASSDSSFSNGDDGAAVHSGGTAATGVPVRDGRPVLLRPQPRHFAPAPSTTVTHRIRRGSRAVLGVDIVRRGQQLASSAFDEFGRSRAQEWVRVMNDEGEVVWLPLEEVCGSGSSRHHEGDVEASPDGAIMTLGMAKSGGGAGVEDHPHALHTQDILGSCTLVRRLVPTGEVECAEAKEILQEGSLSEMHGLARLSLHTSELMTVAHESFGDKREWFNRTVTRLRRTERQHRLDIEIGRESVLVDSIRVLTRLSPLDFRKSWRVRFLGEPGVDSGGVGHNLTYQINPAAGHLLEHPQRAFRFVGRLLGKALVDQQLVVAHLNRPLIKHILGLPVHFEDLEFLDSSLHQTLSWMASNGDTEALSVYFAIDERVNGGRVRRRELVPGGENILVTDMNKRSYVKLRFQDKMVRGVSPLLGALLTGIYEVVPLGMLSVFTAQELELLMCGVAEIDVEDWKANTNYSGGFTANTDIIRWFWDFFAECSNENRSRFLQFVTGTSRVPVGGFRNLQGNDGETRLFTLQRLDNEYAVPRAHTCFNRLDLPNISSQERLVEVLESLIAADVVGFDTA